MKQKTDGQHLENYPGVFLAESPEDAQRTGEAEIRRIQPGADAYNVGPFGAVEDEIVRKAAAGLPERAT